MNKKLFFAAAMALMCANASAQQVKVYDTGRKWNQEFDALIQGQNIKRVAARGLQAVTPDSLLRINVSTAENAAGDVADFIKQAGYEAEAATDQLVVANIPASFIPTLAAQRDVLYVNKTRQLRALMNNVRPETGVTKLQEGTGLDTPYDGTGVLIGVIDQGFEYKHVAFAGRSKKWGSSTASGALSGNAPAADNTDEVGHATHVTNIAAGNKVDGSDYYGVATGSELLMMKSDFNDGTVLLQASAIKKYAEENGMPWVLNMSFGSNLGPHDGSTDYDQNMDKLCGKGAIMVAAMGNSGGEKMHCTYTFESDSTIYIYMKPESGNTNQAVVSEVWGNSNSGEKNLTITPVLVSGSTMYTPTSAQLRQAGFTTTGGINPYNNRQYYSLAGVVTDLASAVSARNGSLLWKVTGKKGETIHAWVEPDQYPCSFTRKTFTITKPTPVSFTTLAGDDNYIVGEGAASVPQAIAVASYNAASSWTSLNGNSYNYTASIGTAKAMSYFSSKGPWLGKANKPTIAAPGGCITSAYSKKSQNFSATKAELVQDVKVNGQHYYYGVMNGTSMATPVVTGIIALWLQANPDLTPADIVRIMQKTGRHDSYTGSRNPDEWSPSWGYGKIDAYEGLKEAINLRTAINETMNTAAPVTLKKDNDCWKVLFNNDESYADIQVVSLGGQTVSHAHLNAPRHGQEHVVSLQGLTPGVYIFRINTTASSLTRKVVVR